MENEFEKYLQQNRDQFEKGSPSPRVWEKLHRSLAEHHERRARVIKMRRIGWSIAASILLCIATMLVILKNKDQVKHFTITRNAAPADNLLDNEKRLAEKIEVDSANRVTGVTDNETRQSLYHYSRLIETREQQMKVLQRVDPDLYARSQKVLIDLNQAYNRLQKQLPGSPDQQKVLKALMQNLKMQERILNNQLQLLNELQQPNNTADEKKEEI